MTSASPVKALVPEEADREIDHRLLLPAGQDIIVGMDSERTSAREESVVAFNRALRWDVVIAALDLQQTKDSLLVLPLSVLGALPSYTTPELLTQGFTQFRSWLDTLRLTLLDVRQTRR
jgi:hypothetical protein|eukprot:5130880-Prymnesium_polylepis.1